MLIQIVQCVVTIDRTCSDATSLYKFGSKWMIFLTETDDLLAEENKDNSWNEKTANSMNSSLHHPHSHAPVNGHDIKEHQQGSIPSSPVKDTKYCINLWKRWRNIGRKILCAQFQNYICDPTPKDNKYWCQQRIRK